MSKSQTHRLWRRFTKKINSHNEVHTFWCQILISNMKVTKIAQKHFLCTFWGFLVIIICDVKIDVNMCEPHYVNLFIFFVNLLHSLCVWLFDIFMTTLHLSWHMGNRTHGQRVIMVNIEDRDGVPWGMGHMGDWGTWGTWAIGHMIITSLILHGSLQKIYWT